MTPYSGENCVLERERGGGDRTETEKQIPFADCGPYVAPTAVSSIAHLSASNQVTAVKAFN